MSEAVQQYIDLRKHMLRIGDRIADKLSQLNCTSPGDWDVLKGVQGLLDELSSVANLNFSTAGGDK